MIEYNICIENIDGEQLPFYSELLKTNNFGTVIIRSTTLSIFECLTKPKYSYIYIFISAFLFYCLITLNRLLQCTYSNESVILHLFLSKQKKLSSLLLLLKNITDKKGVLYSIKSMLLVFSMTIFQIHFLNRHDKK